MDVRSGLGEKISRFFNPSTQVENDNRKKQIKDTMLFVVATGVIVYFRKSIEASFAQLSEAV